MLISFWRIIHYYYYYYYLYSYDKYNKNCTNRKKCNNKEKEACAY